MADSPPPLTQMRQMQSALRADGTLAVERVGLRRSVWNDLFHFLVTLRWGGLFGLIAALYFGINTIFAALYLAGGDCIANARPGSFADAFSFSVQTFATIGYGVYSPSTPWAHMLVSVEALVGIVYSALATGLTFAKFARPTARVLFSQTAPIYMYEGTPTLSIRMANGRFNQIVEASVKIRVSRMETSLEGILVRRLYDLRLVRETNPIFALSWQVFHPIDADSPLFGRSLEQMAKEQTILIVVVSGTDETMAATVQARAIYSYEQFVYNRRFVDIITPKEGGGVRVDYTRFHETDVAPEDHWIPGTRVSPAPEIKPERDDD